MKPVIFGYYLRNEIRTGGHRRYLELLSSLAKEGFTVKVLLASTIDSSQFSFKTIPVKRVAKGKIPYTLKQLFRVIPELFKLSKAFYISLAFGESNLLILKATKYILKSRNIFAFRSNSYVAKRNQLEITGKINRLSSKCQLIKMLKIEKSILKSSDFIVFQTEVDKNDILSRHSKLSISSSIIPNSINEAWFINDYRDLNRSKELRKIIYLGSYDNRKGVIYLIKAMKQVINKGYNIQLDLFGYGKKKQSLLNYVNNNGLKAYIKINDKLSNPLKFIPNYDLMIVPSIYDSYPNVILESIFTGTPVIASNNSGMKAILLYDKLLFKTADHNSIAEKIEYLTHSENYLEAKKLCNIRLSEHDFNWPKQFIYIINDIIKENL